VTLKAFIFDLDGVITDTAEFHYLAWQQLADEEAIPFSRQENEKLRGLSRRASLETMLKGRVVPEESMLEWMERKNNYYREYLRQITPDALLPGVGEFLISARSLGLKLGLGSASKNARDVLIALQVIDLFDVIGDGHSVINGKPAPDLFVWVAGGLHVPPNEAVVFEDAEAGITAAKAGGFYTVGIGGDRVQAADFSVDGLGELTPQQVIHRLEARHQL
jgi:beta-phosphoglucomutase